MDVDESQINEQIEVPALTMDSLDALRQQMIDVLSRKPDSNMFELDADNRYADFAECLSKMRGKSRLFNICDAVSHRLHVHIFQ
jgi:hypothetical protein